MLRLALIVLFSAASAACGFAAVGVALYAQGPMMAAAAAVFGGVGLVAGALCGALPLVLHRLPLRSSAALPADALAGLVRAALASAAAPRERRPDGSAGSPAPLAITGSRNAIDNPTPHLANSVFGA